MENLLSTVIFGKVFCVGCAVIPAVLLLSFQFCGSTIAGLSLLSDSIMRLVREDATNEWLDLLLPRRSLYILRFSIYCTIIYLDIVWIFDILITKQGCFAHIALLQNG